MEELPITLSLAKAHLRIGDATHDDELIAAKLEMAFAIAEDFCNRPLREEFKENFPPAVKAAVLFILGTLYDNESDQLVGRSTSQLQLTAEKLLQPWRKNPYGACTTEE